MEALVGVGIAVAAFAAAVVGGVVGIGTAIVMLPILAAAFGVREGVVVLSVCMTMANVARAIANRREINWPVVRWWALGAVPAAVAGTFALAVAPPGLLARLLGGFFVLVVIYRHIGSLQHFRMPLRAFVYVGASQGVVSALFGAAGPLGVPFFLAYGLTRATFVGTFGAQNTIANGVRLGTQRGLDLLTLDLFVIGMGIGLIMFAGIFVGRWVVTRISERVFTYLIEAVLVAVGLLFLIRGG